MHNGLRGLRLWLLLLSILASAFGAINYYFIKPGDFTWQMWCQILLCFIFLVTYFYTLVGKQTVHRYLRASVMLGLTVLCLYINLKGLRHPEDRGLTPAVYIDHPSDSQSLGWLFIKLPQGFCAILGCFSLWEIALALKVEGRETESRKTESIPL